MKLRLVPARRGMLWVRSGFRVFFRRPLGFASLFALFLVGVALLMLVPVVGAGLVLVALPLVSQVFMIATQRALLGRPMAPGLYLEPLRGARPQALGMLKLGVAYAVGTLLILWLSGVADGGRFEAFEDALLGPKQPDVAQVEAMLGDPQLLLGVALRLGLAGLLSLPFWHAPPLVHWGAQGWAKSLFFSTMACWRNKGAFTAYALTWAAVIMLFGVFVNVVLLALGQAQMVGAAALPAGLMFSTVFYASLYFSFADCFEYQLDPAAPEERLP